MIENKRKLERRHLIYYLRTFNQNSSELIGHLVDITQEGLMLISETPIETGKSYSLRMALPEYFFGKKELEFEAYAIWCRPDVNEDFFDTGFQAKELPDEDKHIIEEMIKDYGFQH